MADAPPVVVCSPERRLAALTWLLDQPPAGLDQALIDEWLHRAADDPAAGAGLLTVWDDGQLAAAMLGTLLPGRLGAITPPRFRGPDDARFLAPLLAEAVDFARRGGARLAQAVLPPGHPAAAAFERAGFRAAELQLLGCELSSVAVEPLSGPVRIEPYANETELAQLVEGTYAGTLDCAWMNGWRDTADVLATSRATGVHDPHLWFVASVEGELLGCLLLADHPQGNSLELVYMGVLPAFRGRGWGRALIAHALRACRARGRARMVLFVDADNWPARRAYLAAGFSEWDRRVCWLRRVG